MNFEKDSVPVLVAELKDNSGNTLKIAMTQLEEDEEFELQTLHPASLLNSKPGAQLSTFWGWKVGPRTVGPRTVGPWDIWSPDSSALEQCINSTDTCSPNVGSIYPIYYKMYIPGRTETLQLTHCS